jgi:hypothetical protein
LITAKFTVFLICARNDSRVREYASAVPVRGSHDFDRQKKTGDLGGGSRSKRFEERGDNRAASGGYGNPARGEDRALQVLLCQYSFKVSLGNN